MEKSIKKGMVVLDIGANIGYFSFVMAKLVGEKGKVYAFEPDPDNYSILKKNIEANSFTNIIPVQTAISDKHGKVRLYLSNEHKGDHRIYDSGDNRKSVRTDSTTIDKFLQENTKIGFAKIDTQGAEFLAILGMKDTIKKNRNLIIILEFWPAGLKKCSSSPEKLLDTLEGSGFQIKVINEENEATELTSRHSLLKISNEGDHCDLFLKKQ